MVGAGAHLEDFGCGAGAAAAAVSMQDLGVCRDAAASGAAPMPHTVRVALSLALMPYVILIA